MKTILSILLLVGTCLAADPSMYVPQSAISAKKMIVRVYWPGGAQADINEVQLEGEQFLRKWKRYEVVEDIRDADLAALVIVKPTTVQPGFWQRLAAGYLQQSHTTCNAYGTGPYATVSCFTNPGNPALAQQLMLPSTVLNGSILIFEATDIRKDMSDNLGLFNGNAKPIMAQFADGRGSRPLIGAAKKLRKAIDAATATAAAAASKP